MQRKLYKELWTMRFQKMLKLEEQSVEDYGALLKESKLKYRSATQLQDHLKQLIVDEKKHAKLVRELLSIVDRQAD